MWSGPRQKRGKRSTEPLLYQSQSKGNIDPSGLEKGEWRRASEEVQREKSLQLSGRK